MKEKIRLALIAKYKNLGFSDKAIEGVLGYLETTVTAEDQIDGAVNAVEGMLKAFQAEADRRATDAAEKAKKPADPNQPTGGDPAKPNEPTNPSDQVPAWAKSLLDKVTALEQGKSTDTRKQALEAKLKDVSETVKNKVLKDFARMKFDTEEEFNTYLSETETDVVALEQNVANNNLGQQGRPLQGGGQATPKQIDADIAAWATAGTKPAEAKA